MEQHYRALERMYLSAPFNEYWQPGISIDDGSATISLEIRPDFHHPAGAAHGSVYFKVLDDATFFSASSAVVDEFILTASFQLYFIRPVSTGSIEAQGKLVSQSRRLLVAEGTVHDDQGRLLARGSGSFVRSGVPLDDNLGYQLKP